MEISRQLNSGQTGKVIWLYGLSGAGKTTIATLLKEKLLNHNQASVILDGDEIRNGLNQDLSFTEKDRTENIRRVSEVAKLLAQNNLIVICALITPLRQQRLLAKNIIGNAYTEVFVDCPLQECRNRDVKGLYQLSDQKIIKNFTGVDAAFEGSYESDLVIHTHLITPAEACNQLFDRVLGGFNLMNGSSLTNKATV